MEMDKLVEQRLAALERAVANLQRRLALTPPATNWIERFAGSFKDDPAFAQVIEYGRAFRSVDRPPQDSSQDNP